MSVGREDLIKEEEERLLNFNIDRNNVNSDYFNLLYKDSTNPKYPLSCVFFIVKFWIRDLVVF